MYLSSEEIRSSSEFLTNRWEGVLPIPAIQKQHVFRRAGTAELLVGRYASDSLQSITVYPLQQGGPQVKAVEPQALSLSVGDWVLVKYDGSCFPGEVKAVVKEEVQVSVMIPSGSIFYKWPTPEDSIFYQMDNVVRKLKPPILKSARGTYEFLEKW